MPMPLRIFQAKGRRLTWLCLGLEAIACAVVAGQILIAVALAGRLPWLELGGLVVLTSGPAVALVVRLPKIIQEIAEVERVLNDGLALCLGLEDPELAHRAE